jgi:molybdopterin molybdotransferase
VSPAPLPLDEARAQVVAAVSPLESEPVGVGEALGRVLAEDVAAAGDVPPFANSAMDGFAVPPGPAGRELRVVDEARAGRPAGQPLGEDEAIRISTGAPLPAGATAVVPVERVAERDGVVVPEREVGPRDNVRDAGEDMRAGAVVVSRGTRLGAGELAAVVAAGRGEVHCARRPRVAVLVTGDELAPAGAALRPGQIHNSNAVALRALVEGEGAVVVADRLVPDDRDATQGALREALEGAADVVLVSGGVSVGPHDHVKPALDALGVRERFWRVAVKPGKPAWFGTREATLVFGLPGNPVSAFVCCVLLARPALRALQGAQSRPREQAVLAEPVRRARDRAQAVRVALIPGPDGRLAARPTGPQGSHMLSSLLGADALALIPAGEGELAAGEPVELERLAP